MTLSPGARLGPYEIQSAISAGGMGEVYKARDTRLGGTAAIKVLPVQFSAGPDQRFGHLARYSPAPGSARRSKGGPRPAQLF